MKISKYEWSKPKGYVYILDGTNGLYKIGMTKNPKVRFKTLTVNLPFDLTVVCLIGSYNYQALEIELHEVFASKRVRGEWFALDSNDLEWLIDDAGAMGTSIYVNDNYVDDIKQKNFPYFTTKVGSYEI